MPAQPKQCLLHALRHQCSPRQWGSHVGTPRAEVAASLRLGCPGGQRLALRDGLQAKAGEARSAKWHGGAEAEGGGSQQCALRYLMPCKSNLLAQADVISSHAHYKHNSRAAAQQLAKPTCSALCGSREAQSRKLLERRACGELKWGNKTTCDNGWCCKMCCLTSVARAAGCAAAHSTPRALARGLATQKARQASRAGAGGQGRYR